MNKPKLTELNRKFLLETLPEPLYRASSHLQIFDNYIANTRMRLRLIRDPQSKQWSRRLQQRTTAGEIDQHNISLFEMHLNDAEYAVFERFRGSEIRKNRYFHDFGTESWCFDVYLGEPRGLCIGTIVFALEEDPVNFEPPPFALIEITGDAYFAGENLVKKTYAEIREEVARLGKSVDTTAFAADD